MADSDVISELLDSIKRLLTALQGKQHFSDYIEAAEKTADRAIAKTLNDSSVQYLGGKCLFRWDAFEQSVDGGITLYFVRNGHEYFQKSMRHNISASKLLDDELSHLKQNGQIVFDIKPPKNMQKGKCQL